LKGRKKEITIEEISERKSRDELDEERREFVSRKERDKRERDKDEASNAKGMQEIVSRIVLSYFLRRCFLLFCMVVECKNLQRIRRLVNGNDREYKWK